MVLHNPNNWHWVNKDTREWARTYLNEHLPQLSAEKDDVKARIIKVGEMEGDCDVSQRKGKVITLFDLVLDIEFEGSTAEDDNVTGTIKIPEVAHDTEEDEYQFDIRINNTSSKREPVKDLIRSDLVPKLRKTLAKLGPDMMAEHGKDIQHAPGSGPPTGYSTPTYRSSTPQQSLNKTSSSAAATTTSGGGKAPLINTVPLSVDTEFRTSAVELYTTFTDPQRVAAFTRSPPATWEGARPGGKFALFGGGVQGEFVELEAPRRVVQTWRLQQWPAGHFSRLELAFEQDDAQGVTVMRSRWDRVPVGEEESTREKWGEYYVRSLKTTFGQDSSSSSWCLVL